MQWAYAIFCGCIKHLVYISANGKYSVAYEDKSLGSLALEIEALLKTFTLT